MLTFRKFHTRAKGMVLTSILDPDVGVHNPRVDISEEEEEGEIGNGRRMRLETAG